MTKLKIEQLPAFMKGIAAEVDEAARLAGRDALRTSRREVVKYVRGRKGKLQTKRINESMRNKYPRKGLHLADMQWTLEVKNKPMEMEAFPHSPQILGPGGGVRVEINKGKPTLIKNAFIATMSSGHTGIFARDGKSRLPISELFSSSIADVLHDGLAHEKVRSASQATFNASMERFTRIGIEKLPKKMRLKK